MTGIQFEFCKGHTDNNNHIIYKTDTVCEKS